MLDCECEPDWVSMVDWDSDRWGADGAKKFGLAIPLIMGALSGSASLLRLRFFTKRMNRAKETIKSTKIALNETDEMHKAEEHLLGSVGTGVGTMVVGSNSVEVEVPGVVVIVE